VAATDIDWADEVWNPTTGCDWVSAGCDNCYAMALARRLKLMERERMHQGKLDPERAKYQNDGDPKTSGPGFLATQHVFVLYTPLLRKRPCKWFINSMSDLFHKNITTEFIAAVFAVIAATPHHTYQLLTKRPPRMRHLLSSTKFWCLVREAINRMPVREEVRQAALAATSEPLPNLWVGVSVENQSTARRRIPELLRTPAALRWLSCEPLIARLDLSTWLTPEGRLHWIVLGGESGSGAKPMQLEWALEVQALAKAASVPYYFKQPGRILAREWGIKGKGNDPARWPRPFPREFPETAAV
jgi:protein gp37